MTSGNISPLRTRIISILVFVCFTLVLQAQEISKYDLEERAGHYFRNQRYDKAIADYEVLYKMYPKDAGYAYYLGRCYLHSNRYLDRASDLLKFSATRNFGDDSYFYLGQAYHLSYSFEDAALAYITFQKTASSRTLKKFDVDYYLAQTASAKQAIEVAQDLQVENLLVVPSHTIESAFNVDMGGKYIYVPDFFKSETDKEIDYTALMFLPNTIEVGDYVYFSSQSKNSRQGSEIYCAKRVNEEDYSLPEPLSGVINTRYDEAYPFYDKFTSTLYFSSKGHNTSGGYDIFKSKFDPELNAWSSPEKLAFPINSVHDDFLYTPTRNQNEIMFVTNRNSGITEYEAYTLELVNPGDYVSPADKDQVLTLAMLSPSSITIDAPLLAQLDQQLDPQVEQTVSYTSESNSKYFTSASESKTYASLIEEALELQAHSDSLGAAAQSLRIKVRDVTNYQKKQELVATITTLDKESKLLHNQADARFREADQLRQTDTQGLLADNTKSQATATTPTGITLYTYDAPAQTVAKREDAGKNQDTYDKGYAAAAEMGKELASSFSIMNKSPYSQNNPIPMAAIPGGLVYRIQLGSYAQEIPENTFGGLAPVSKETASSATKYYVGVFASITEARGALEKVKEYGYPDAFLVSFYNHDKISVQEAREIEFADR